MSRRRETRERALTQDSGQPEPNKSHELLGRDLKPPRILPKSKLHSLWLKAPQSIRRLTYEALIWVGGMMYESESVCAQRLPFNLYAKRAPRTSPVRVLRAEGLTMLLVAANTTVPTPEVLDLLGSDDDAFIIMTRLPGKPLIPPLTLDTFTPDQLQQFESDLGECFRQIRAIPAPSSMVSGFGGAPLMIDRIHVDEWHGPFSSIQEFHKYLYKFVPRRFHADLKVKAQRSHGKPHRLCLTQGDLHPGNILVQNGRLTGIIDWECGGWYPEYWEYTRACYSRQGYTTWLDVFGRIFPQYKDELEVEEAFWKVSNPW